MDTNTTAVPADESDDAVLARLEADFQERAKASAEERKAADVAVARKLLELRATGGGDLFAAGDSGGPFRGIFRPPIQEAWKAWKSDMRGDQQRTVANQNLVNKCLVWPTLDVLAAAAAKRPALYDVLGIVLQEWAGAGQDALVKG